jgi:hypothetical protein
MNTKLLAVVSTGALLLMSGSADAGGKLPAWFKGVFKQGSVLDQPQIREISSRAVQPRENSRPVQTREISPQTREISPQPREISPQPQEISHNDLSKNEKLIPSEQLRRDIIDLKVSSLYHDATPGILDGLKVPEALTEQQVKKIVHDEVKKAIESATKEKGSDITFDVPSGELNGLRWGRVTAKVNIAGISFFVAREVIKCMKQPDFTECAKAVLADVESKLEKGLVPEEARIPEKTSTILE